MPVASKPPSTASVERGGVDVEERDPGALAEEPPRDQSTLMFAALMIPPKNV